MEHREIWLKIPTQGATMKFFFDVVLRYRFRPKLKSNYMDAESVTPVHRQTMIENIFLHYVHEALQGA